MPESTSTLPPFPILIPVPSMGATVNELTLLDLFVQEGDQVKKGQKLAEFESDKSVFDFEAPGDGCIRQIHGRAGDILASESPFLVMETGDATLSHLRQHETPIPVSPSKATRPSRSTAPSVSPETIGDGRNSPAAEKPLVWTPKALKLAREAGLDPDSVKDISANGPGGRVSGDDVSAYLAKLPSAVSPVAPAGKDFSTATIKPAGARGTVCLAGIGYAFPKTIRSNREILEGFPGMTEEEIVRITGIQQRYYADESESATSLATQAVEHALAQANLNATDIDGIIMATLIPDQPVPGAASALARALGIRHALAFDLNAACSGWLYALEVGRSFLLTGTAKKLIVVTAELLSRITNPRDHSTAFLFGDGAGAAILTDAGGGHRLGPMTLSGDAHFYEAIQRTGGGARCPVPRPGDTLDSFFITMNGAVVFKQAVIAFAELIENTLRRYDMSPQEVSWIVPHQANERILRAVSKRVGIGYDKFVVTIGKYGNTSAASVSMALGWAADEGIFQPGDKIIFCSVGAGFTFASGLLTW